MELALGNIFVRTGGPLQNGEVVHTHCHNFDHVTYIPHGSAIIEQMTPPTDENPSGTVLQAVTKSADEGRNFVLIKAECWHRITALEDGTIYHCIFAHRNPQGDVVQEYDGWVEANT